jgi:hypothetical protein
MTVATTSAPQVAGTDHIESQTSWRARRRTARQLRLRDQTSARLAELDQIACILNEAADLVHVGWLQHSWFAYRDDAGQIRTVNAYNAKQMKGHPVVEACLVGAIVAASGGLSQIRTQVVQRTIDLAWNTLFKTPSELIRQTPAPVVRMQRVQDLTRWNDYPGRTAWHAEELLRRSARAAQSEAEMRRRTADQATFAVV